MFRLIYKLSVSTHNVKSFTSRNNFSLKYFSISKEDQKIILFKKVKNMEVITMTEGYF